MDMVALKKCTASQQLRKNQQWAGCKPNKFPPKGGRGDFSLDISSHRTAYRTHDTASRTNPSPSAMPSKSNRYKTFQKRNPSRIREYHESA
jgi:hypothetical protein